MRTISASLMMQSILSSYRHSLFLQLLTMTILTGLQLPALVKGFPYELCNLGAVVGLFGYFLVAVAFLCKGKQVKTNWHKIVAVRPSKRKYGKSLLVFMFHMAIYPCGCVWLQNHPEPALLSAPYFHFGSFGLS